MSGSKHLPRSLGSDAVHCSGSWIPTPAFGRASVPPARRISLKGDNVGIGRALPLRKMTSAAFGVGRDSVAEALAVGCPVSAFIATAEYSGVLPDEESRTRHAPIWRFRRS